MTQADELKLETLMPIIHEMKALLDQLLTLTDRLTDLVVKLLQLAHRIS